MKKSKNLIGKKFGELLVTGTEQPTNDRHEISICQCLICGAKIKKRSSDLLNGNFKNHQRHFINLTNKRINKLTVIEQILNDKQRNNIPEVNGHRNEAKWLCICDCGNKKIFGSTILSSGRVDSCGCARNKGYKEIYKGFYGSIKHGAKTRNIVFDITMKQMWDLFIKQNKKCVFTNIKLQFSSKSNSRDGTASLDRIDSSKGYTIDNVQWVHKNINKMKMDSSDLDFIKWCKLVADNNKKILNKRAKI